MKNKKLFTFLQKLSRAFLVPMGLISASALLLGISSVFSQESLTSAIPFFASPGFKYFLSLVKLVGTTAMGNLPVIYAITLSFAFSKDDKEYAAFSGFIGYFALIASMGMLINNFENVTAMFHEKELTNVLGINTLRIDIIGGIIVGLIVPILHKKFRTIKLPMAFAFFQGVRFVPFITSIVFIIIGQIIPFVWVPFAKFIENIAGAVDNLGAFGVFLYASVERLLIPTGLHGVFNNIIKRTAASGTWIFNDGFSVGGSLNAFEYYMTSGATVTNHNFLDMFKFLRGIQIPMTVFAIPATAYAMFKSSDKDKMKIVKPLYVAAAFSAVFAGITEPIEFLFLFTAPLLFLIYSGITGLAAAAMYLMGAQIGGSEGNLIGFFVYGVFRSESNFYVAIIVGILAAFVCYFVFSWYIKKFNVKTPGRGGDYDESLALAAEFANVSLEGISEKSTDEFKTTDPKKLKAQLIIKGLGGNENIVEIDSCMSRLRVLVNDMSKVDESVLKTTGCNGIVKPDNTNIQIIYGPAVSSIKDAVKKIT